MINTINTDVHTAQATLDAALTAHQALPARLPLAQVHPGQQVLDTETKLIHHAIRIAAFNTAQIAGTCDPHRHRLHPRRRRSPHPDPHRPGRLRRHHPRRPPTPCTSASTRSPHHGTPPPSTNSADCPQRHPHRLPQHRPHPALQHQIPPMTLQPFRRYVRSPGAPSRFARSRYPPEVNCETGIRASGCRMPELSRKSLCPPTELGGRGQWVFGGVLLFHPVWVVSSALAGLASGFGMGPGVSLPLWPP